MLCDECGQNVATVKLTEIVNQKKSERHLCEDCARNKGISVQPELDTSAVAGAAVAIGASLLKAASGALVRQDELSALSCPVCGITFAQFRASGRLGCANDYVAFRRGLLQLCEKIHGSTQHTGRVPRQVHERLQRRREVAALREELNRAIQGEDYEARRQAARRDLRARGTRARLRADRGEGGAGAARRGAHGVVRRAAWASGSARAGPTPTSSSRPGSAWRAISPIAPFLTRASPRQRAELEQRLRTCIRPGRHRRAGPGRCRRARAAGVREPRRDGAGGPAVPGRAPRDLEGAGGGRG
ncbi:MAG: hypothetical protein KatS3mg102_0246 [Planctomycetota bacterium]|nr:MAG: hypothetical protein KatS3mg102_0246 [Planctomycetota bacterium]